MGPVEAAARSELAEMGPVGQSAIAASAIALAQMMDQKPYSLTATELRMSMETLRALAPVKMEDGPIDQLRAHRAKSRPA